MSELHFVIVEAKAHLKNIEDIQSQAETLGRFDMLKKAELAETAVSESVELSKKIVLALALLAGES